MDDDGGYWTGYNFRDNVIGPKEKTTWTAGVILLAADALTQHSGAANLFTQHLCTENVLGNTIPVIINHTNAAISASAD